MKPIGEVVDEFLAPVPPLPSQHIVIAGKVWVVDHKCGPLLPGDKFNYNLRTGMLEKRKPEN